MSLPLYKAGDNWPATGTHTVKYTPYVKGQYKIDVQLPHVNERQQIKISCEAGGSGIAGTFNVIFNCPEDNTVNPINCKTSNIPFDASANTLQIRLEELNGIQAGTISVKNILTDANGGRTWEVEFLSGNGDAHKFYSDATGLTGNNVQVSIVELTKGIGKQHIDGSPFFIDVVPDKTDPYYSCARAWSRHGDCWRRS
jgi:hypothetical protein